MNFFEHQDKAHRKTKLLVFLFLLAVLSIVLAVNALVYGILFYSDLLPQFKHDILLADVLWRYLTGGVLAVILSGTLIKLFLLRRGGRAVAEMVGARRMSMDTENFKERRLINIVEEMAIASGITMPALYVMEQEPAINAFVAGTRPVDTVLVVTQGTLDTLNRDELQGVIGHEFSHIFNGDMQINVRLMGVLAGILAIGQVGRFLLQGSARTRVVSGRRRSRGGGGSGVIIIVALGIFAIGYIGLFFGSLIKAALSRQRELLADACSVQYTRNPRGIAGALIKIKHHGTSSHLVSKNSEDISHMCFGESLRHFLSFFNTHPPLDDRIKRLDPSGTLESEYLIDAEKEDSVEEAETQKTKEKKTERDPIMPAHAAMGVMIGAMAATEAAQSAQKVSDKIGLLDANVVQKGESLHEQIPENILKYAHDSYQTQVLILSLLMPTDEEQLLQAKRLVEQKLGDIAWQFLVEIQAEVKVLPRELYLPIIEIGMSALLQNHESHLERFLDLLDAFIKLDKKMSPFEFSIVTLVKHRIRNQKPAKTLQRFDTVLDELSIVLSFILAASKMSKDEQAICYEKAFSNFSKKTVYRNMRDLKPARVQAALFTLNGLTPKLKQTVIDTLAECILHDHHVYIEEAELFRAIAACLDCPVPPLVA